MAVYPRFVCDTIEKRGHAAEVRAIEQVSPGLLRVHLDAPTLAGSQWRPCDVTALRVSDGEFRHYTPDAVDTATGRTSILFALHGGAPPPPGMRLITSWTEGARTALCGLESGRGFGWKGGDRVLVLGDASTVGLFASMLGLPDHARRVVTGAVEVPAPDVDAAQALLPGVDVLAADPGPGTALDRWVTGNAGRISGSLAPDHAYLSGHGQSIQRQRSALRALGLDRRSIHTQPYWATGRTGL